MVRSGSPARKMKETAMMLIRITDADSHDYDLFVPVPEGVEDTVVIDQVDDAVRRVREADPDEYNVDDLRAVLGESGLEIADVRSSAEAF